MNKNLSISDSRVYALRRLLILKSSLNAKDRMMKSFLKGYLYRVLSRLAAFLQKQAIRLAVLTGCDVRFREAWINFYPVEFLLPQVKKNIKLAEFPFIQRAVENSKWDKELLTKEVKRLGHWEYYFPFAHGVSTKLHATFSDGAINFHRFRSSLISETLVEFLGNDKGNATVLDMACHCGVFSLDVASRGVMHVHGIEYREKNLNQAKFLQDYYGIENVTFEKGDVYQLNRDKKYDVVMCLGILYHVVQPVELIEYCYNNSNKFAVIDTICHKQPIPAYAVIGDKNVKCAIEGTRPIEFQPTYRGLIETMKQVGFTKIVEVVGSCDIPIDLYADGARRCFIAFK